MEPEYRSVMNVKNEKSTMAEILSNYCSHLYSKEESDESSKELYCKLTEDRCIGLIQESQSERTPLDWEVISRCPGKKRD